MQGTHLVKTDIQSNNNTKKLNDSPCDQVTLNNLSKHIKLQLRSLQAFSWYRFR